MSWSNFETADGQIISINMDEVVSVINYPNDRADILMRNGCMHTVTFIGPWEPEEQHPLPDLDPEKLKEDIQDIKTEYDRLKHWNVIMFDFISSISCRKKCHDCKLYRPALFDKLGAKCAYLQGAEGLSYIREEAARLLDRQEDL